MCCQVAVCATGWSLECDSDASIMRRSWPTGAPLRQWGRNISLAVQITKLLITHFSPVSCYLLLPRPKCLSQHPVPEYTRSNFTFMLPCIVIDFFLNNQPHALIIQIYSVIKLFYMFRGIFSAHHQEFCTVHSALVSFMQVFWWPLPNRVRMEQSSILKLLDVLCEELHLPLWRLTT